MQTAPLRGGQLRAYNAKRAEEYAFLLYSMLVATAYGVAHDHVTATISPEYFLRWKGLAGDPALFRWAVTVLAVRASAWAGLVVGATLLMATGPRRGGTPAQLSYRELMKLSLVPLALALLVAATLGGMNSMSQFGAATAAGLVGPERVRAFVVVWATHAGSYAGALVGAIASAVVVVMRRRTLTAPASTPRSARCD